MLGAVCVGVSARDWIEMVSHWRHGKPQCFMVNSPLSLYRRGHRCAARSFPVVRLQSFTTAQADFARLSKAKP